MNIMVSLLRVALDCNLAYDNENLEEAAFQMTLLPADKGYPDYLFSPIHKIICR